MVELVIRHANQSRQASLPNIGKDMLKHDALNALPGPLRGRFAGGDIWPIYDIEPQCAILRIDVSGKPDVKEFCELMVIIDIEGDEHDPEDFWKGDRENDFRKRS